MKEHLVAFLSGSLFAFGLALGGMTDPGKVQAFLDVAGSWDPSLAFVMGGALLVYAPVYRWSQKRDRPLLDTCYHLPTKTQLDPRLVGGAAIFGVGWGMAGYCPGPALTSLGTGVSALVFVSFMLLGLGVTRALTQRRSDRASPANEEPKWKQSAPIES